MGVGPRILVHQTPHVLRVSRHDVARRIDALIVVGSPVTHGVLDGVEERLLRDAPSPIVTVLAPPNDAIAPGG